MNTVKQLPASTHGGSFLKSKKAAFLFDAAEKKLEKQLSKKEEITQDMEEKPKPFKVWLSFICIGIAIVLGYIEAENVKNSIVGIGSMNANIALLIGWTFSCMGLVTGEQLVSSFKKDEFTGRKRPTSKFYLALLLTLIYITGQYYLASRAGIGASDDLQETVTTVKWFVLGIAIIEVLFGALFLKIAFQMLTLFTANIRTKRIMRQMNHAARYTEEWWLRYVFEVQTYNDAHSPGVQVEAETPMITRAREFYNSGGFQLSNDISFLTANN